MPKNPIFTTTKQATHTDFIGQLIDPSYNINEVQQLIYQYQESKPSKANTFTLTLLSNLLVLLHEISREENESGMPDHLKAYVEELIIRIDNLLYRHTGEKPNDCTSALNYAKTLIIINFAKLDESANLREIVSEKSPGLSRLV